MIESAVVLTPLHYAYLIGVIVILAVMVLKKDTVPTRRPRPPASQSRIQYRHSFGWVCCNL